jgi:hypothetical protein
MVSTNCDSSPDPQAMGVDTINGEGRGGGGGEAVNDNYVRNIQNFFPIVSYLYSIVWCIFVAT